MKKKIVFISISLFSILVLICIQAFLISRIYKLESEKFDYRYRELVNDAMGKIMVENNSNGLTKSFYVLDRVSNDLLTYIKSKKELEDNPGTEKKEEQRTYVREGPYTRKMQKAT